MAPSVYRAIEKTIEHVGKHLIVHGVTWVAERYSDDIRSFGDFLVEKYKGAKERKTEKSK